MNTQLPVAGWLSTSSIECQEWTSYFFVLLDTEIRVYNNEFEEEPLNMLELKKIYRIDAVFTDYKYTFQLTLNDYASSWIIRCDTEFDMKLWMRAIKQRKTRYPTGGDKTPLLARRNKKLAPIMTQSTHQPLFTSSSSSYSSSISSSTSSQFSPLTTRAPPLYDQCAFKAIKEAQPSAYNNKLSIQSHTEIEDDELSPTYLLYKKKFRL